MEKLSKTTFLAGTHRSLTLYPSKPDPSCIIIPSEDKLNLLLRFSISSDEAEQAQAIRSLRKVLTPRIHLDSDKCMLEYDLISVGKRYYFDIQYHIYDEKYGKSLYNMLKDKLFE